MPEPLVFRWIEIESFRGFRDRQRISLEASVVLLVGPNGTGKTSFFDAVQWLLAGSIKRLEAWRVRRNDEHIVNRYRSGKRAEVRASVVLGGIDVELRREGTYEGGALEWLTATEELRGNDAEKRLRSALSTRPGEDVRQQLLSSALLQQDVLREVLEERPADRYQQLAMLLGLEELSQFSQATRVRADELAKTAREARVRLTDAESRARARIEELAQLERDLPLAADVRQQRDRVISALTELAAEVVVSPMPATSADAAVLQQVARDIGTQLSQLLSSFNETERERNANPPPVAAELDARRAALREAEENLATAERAAVAAEAALAEAVDASSRLTALAVSAVDLLGPTCPVCGQDIDREHVAQHLQTRISGEDKGLEPLTNAARRAREAVTARQNDAKVAEQALAPLVAAAKARERAESAYKQWVDRCAGWAPTEGPIALARLAAIRAGDLDAAQAALQALRAAWTHSGELAAALRTDATDERIVQLRAAVSELTETVDARKADLQRASAAEQRAKVLQRAAVRAVGAVAESRFRSLAPTIQDIYSRLDPHPAFTAFDVEVETYREQSVVLPVVRDERADVTADPLLVFSSSQANVAALSYFLALGWAAGDSGLPFLMLDDPLQSMDDVNALGFADLCRHVRRQRQLILSTHDRRLAALLGRKLAPRSTDERTKLIEFKAWTEEGPQFDETWVESQMGEGEARHLVHTDAA